MKLKINKEKLVQNINQRKKGIGGRLKGIAITNPCWAICCNCCGGGISYWLTTAMVSTSDGITNTPINTTLYNSTSYTTLPYTWISATAPTTITFATPYDEPLAVFQGRAYKKDDAYYFLIESIIAYLYAKGFGSKKINLYAALSNVGASTASFENVEVWRFYENPTFKQLEVSRKRIKEIETKTLTLEIEARFADKKKEIE